MYLVKQLFFKHFCSVPINQRLYGLKMAKMFAQICFYLPYLYTQDVIDFRAQWQETHQSAAHACPRSTNCMHANLNAQVWFYQ